MCYDRFNVLMVCSVYYITYYIIYIIYIAIDIATKEKGKGSAGLLAAFLDLIKREILHFYEDFYSSSAQGEAGGGAAGGQGQEGYAAELATVEKDFAAAISAEPRDGLAELRAGIAAQAAGTRVPWQDCVLALGLQDVPRLMWAALGDGDKALFDARYRTIAQVYFNGMPLASASDMNAYLGSGWCSLRGGLQGVDLLSSEQGDRGDRGDSFKLSFSQAGGRSGAAVLADHVVNATGFEKSFAHPGAAGVLSPLFAQLLADGTVEADRFGGLVCDFGTGRLMQAAAAEQGRAGAAAPLLYGVGHLVSGTKLFTSGLSYCNGDASLAVSDVLAALAAPSPVL
jgi:hypothetical protein